MKKYSKIQEATRLVLQPICEKYGPMFKIISLWQEIVGTNIAAISTPIDVISPGNKHENKTIIIGVNNPGFALEIQAAESLIISKLSIYFGYNFINRIKIKVIRKSNINNNTQFTKQQLTKSSYKSVQPLKDQLHPDEDLAINNSISKISDKELIDELKILKESLFFIYDKRKSI